jgi:hypothetical protein
MRFLKKITIVLLISVLFGCATGSTIVTGNARPAIDPNEVKIYLVAPLQYEIIGIVEASSDVEFSRQAAMDRVINELKSRSAKLGANGLLLTDTGSQSGGTTGYFSSGFYYSSTSTKITGQGRAIYIIQE